MMLARKKGINLKSIFNAIHRFTKELGEHFYQLPNAFEKADQAIKKMKAKGAVRKRCYRYRPNITEWKRCGRVIKPKKK